LTPQLNWQAHAKYRLALRGYRIRTVSRMMSANGIPRRLARKVAWAVAMSTAAYGIEAMWEGQKRLSSGFDKLTASIVRAVAGTFRTAKSGGANPGGRYSTSGLALD